MRKIIHYIGKRSKFVRRLYYKHTHGRWLWGIIGFIKDNPGSEKVAFTPDPISEFEGWTASIMEDIFRVK